MSRRQALVAGTLLAGTGFLALDATGLPGGLRIAHAADDEFTRMRAQWRAAWIGSDYDPADPALAPVLAHVAADARQWWSSMATGSDRTFLWEDAKLDVQLSFAISISFGRLQRMALGWATPGTPTYGDAALLAALVDALDWMVAHYYREDGEIIGNWFEWMIAGPQAFNVAAMLVYDELTPAQVGAYTRAVGHYTPEPIATAANRVLTADVVIGRGILAGDASAVRLGVDGLAPVLAYAEEGDGFHRDGSFLQHEFYPYNGSYGVGLIGTLPGIFQRVAGTQFALTDPVVYEWIRDAYDPLIWRGGLMDMASGRVIARFNEQDHYAGHAALHAALGLVAAAPADVRSWLAPMVKEWLRSDALDDPLRGRSIPVVLNARALLADDSVPRRGPLETSHVFAAMDRVVHRRRNWAYGISMCSKRIATFESINDENLHGWLTADGATYLYDAQLDHYNDAFWPTVDPYRIPGTTVDVRVRQPSEGRGYLNPQDWVGGATLDRRYTAAGMMLSSQGSSLVSQKSWFCFDDEVVALGAGIGATDGRRVETVVENRRLRDPGDAQVLVDGERAVGLPGSATEVGAGWVHLSDVGGYVFPQRTNVHLRRETRTGRWSDITQHPSWKDDTPLSRTYLTLWLDHGVDPVDAHYAYVLLPTADVATTRRYATRPGTAVVANSTAVQAVRALDCGVLAANLWLRDERASVVRTDAPASVVLREGDDDLAVAVSDPTRSGGTIRLDLAVTATEVVAADPGVEVVAMEPLTVRVDAGRSGAAVTLRVRYRRWTVDEVRAGLAAFGPDDVEPPVRRSLDARLSAIGTALANGRDVRDSLWAVRTTLADERGRRISEPAADVLDDGVQRLYARAPG